MFYANYINLISLISFSKSWRFGLNYLLLIYNYMCMKFKILELKKF